MIKNILVTGSAGFIGFHLCKKLIENGINVIGIDNINDYYDTKLKNERIKILSQTSSKKNIYLHRFAIHPDYQGQGFAKYVMDYIENYAKENGCLSVRLDTFSLNKKNNYLYSKLGYKKLGKIYFRDQSDMPFNCYEKLL